MTDTPPHSIPQPLLRKLGEHERIVRVANLKFILPNEFDKGEVLEGWKLDFINSAYHTQIINAFSETRKELVGNPATTYSDIEDALLEFAASYSWNHRPTKPPTLTSVLTDTQKARIKFARPFYSQIMSGRGFARADYELGLFDWTEQNAELLDDMRTKHEADMAKLQAAVDNLPT